MNWRCSLRRVGVTNYLFHATDRAMYETLVALGEPVFYYESNLALEYKAKTGVDASGPQCAVIQLLF